MKLVLCSIGNILGWVRLSSITKPNRRQSNDWSSIGFDYLAYLEGLRGGGTKGGGVQLSVVG